MYFCKVFLNFPNKHAILWWMTSREKELQRHRANHKRYREANREKELARQKRYREANREKELARQRRYRQMNKEKTREYLRRRWKTDPLYKVTKSLRRRLIGAVKSQKARKHAPTLELLGCSIVQLKEHLELQFVEGMSWDNHGEWHIDHIIPCASFDLSDPEDQKKCFHYSNLQPLWAVDNIKKGDKIHIDLGKLSKGFRGNRRRALS